jgi:hypothetical protein
MIDCQSANVARSSYAYRIKLALMPRLRAVRLAISRYNFFTGFSLWKVFFGIKLLLAIGALRHNRD